MGTDYTTLSLEDGKYVVKAGGGYDGYIERDFEEVEDAMDFIASLWDLNSSTSAFAQGASERDTMRRINRRKFHQQHM